MLYVYRPFQYVMAMRREERMSSRLNVFLVATFVGSLFFLAALFVTVSLYFWYDNSNKIGYILLTCAPFIILTANICLALAIHFTNFAILTQ